MAPNSSFRSRFPKKIFFTFFKKYFLGRAPLNSGRNSVIKSLIFQDSKLRNNRGLEKFIAKAQCFIYFCKELRRYFFNFHLWWKTCALKSNLFLKIKFCAFAWKKICKTNKKSPSLEAALQDFSVQQPWCRKILCYYFRTK